MTADVGATVGERGLYSLYGLTVAADLPFAGHLAPGAGTPDLTLACVDSPPALEGLEEAKPVYTSPSSDEDDGGAFYLYRLKDCLVMRWPPLDFYLWPDRIVCYLRDPKYYPSVEMLLLNVVFACWLEWRGLPALHCSAVVVDDRAAAFLAVPGSGKSSLAATMMQAGYPLLTDDLLPVEYSGGEYLGRPSYPQMRMWPDRAQHVLGHYEDLEFVVPQLPKRRVPVGEGGFGAFCGTPQSLSCLYLPERRDPVEWGTQIRIAPVSPREELMELIQHSFAVGVVQALGMHGHRLGFFARMVPRVPMRRILFPSGSEYLPRVRQAILDDLAGLRSPTLPEAVDG